MKKASPISSDLLRQHIERITDDIGEILGFAWDDPEIVPGTAAFAFRENLYAVQGCLCDLSAAVYVHGLKAAPGCDG